MLINSLKSQLGADHLHVAANLPNALIESLQYQSAMAHDPQIQDELLQIQQEFAIAELDGLTES